MMFEDKVVLVTGGTNGMGLDTAIALAKEGAKVVVCGRCEEKGRAAVSSVLGVEEKGFELHFIKCDIQSETDVKTMIDTIVSQYGRLDYAFNNAGVSSSHARLADASYDDWRNAVDINLNGTFLCMKYEIAAMLLSGGGAIVNNSSCAGVMAIPGQAAYVASKAGVIGLTQSAAIDYANSSDGKAVIRINAIAPGPILGGMNNEENLQKNPITTKKKIGATAMQRFGRSAEVIPAVLWLLSEESSYVTGIVLPIDGGFTAGKF